ncbi:MAG TPA: DCC1-like thiol-disulfide oxidoreductase family protein [Ignavibacteria bacterium]|nr:DCC1-like thiol-disulfide oxidoreductase family protein [Ignavibacteria bacterium]HMQ99009.1 DCC1-like thiol-disulfide oxidoreductase family protein [Ignavibacteria bacterium]
MSSDHKIILFDGVCNICNGSVNFFITRDKKDIFRFVALQSDIGVRLQKELNIDHENIESFILIDGNAYYKKSTAALKVAGMLGFPYNLLYPLLLIPPFIRNIVYDIVAKYRYKWFGKKSTCRVPTPKERNKFL